jgi:hypothetical protein
MTSQKIIRLMAKGSTLCMGWRDGERQYWLEPSRLTVRSDMAEKIITLPGIKPGGDSLFHDLKSQTWRLSAR